MAGVTSHRSCVPSRGAKARYHADPGDHRETALPSTEKRVLGVWLPTCGGDCQRGRPRNTTATFGRRFGFEIVDYRCDFFRITMLQPDQFVSGLSQSNDHSSSSA